VGRVVSIHPALREIMSLQADIRSMFANAKTSFPDLIVTVISGTQSAQGVKYLSKTAASLDNDGEKGLNTGTVHVDSSEISEPAPGATIKVAGKDVFVLETIPDAAGALVKINYQTQRPVTFSGDPQ
jgi:Rieske Fe-S protein